MSLKIRLSRGGAKKRPFYRIVVADSRSPRDGRFIERVGTYNPMVPRDHPERVVLKEERIRHWLSVGAQPTNRVAKFKQQIARANVDDKTVARQEAVILSMTPAERRNSKILNASRRRRIAAGSGTSVQEVNRLLKQYQQMNAMMKKVGKMGKKGMARAGGLPPGFMPPRPPVR